MVKSALANLLVAHAIDWLFKNVGLNSQKHLAKNYMPPISAVKMFWLHIAI